MNELILGDCLEIMKDVPDGSVDMILADLPYGTTACAWDSIIPFEPLWEQYWRVCKPNAAVVLTASQPFTTALIHSQIKNFRYEWIWDKVNLNTGALIANKRPMKRHENICVFYTKQPTYNKQFQNGIPVKGGHRSDHGEFVGKTNRQNNNIRSDKKNPCSVIQIKGMSPEKGLHPTQKPVELFEYLIKTYTNEGETVLDNCAGSGTTAIAAINTNRNWICIEKEQKYYDIASKRIEDHKRNLTKIKFG